MQRIKPSDRVQLGLLPILERYGIFFFVFTEFPLLENDFLPFLYIRIHATVVPCEYWKCVPIPLGRRTEHFCSTVSSSYVISTHLARGM